MFAQNSLVGVIGEPPNAAEYHIPGIPGVAFVDLFNGNLHLELPLRTVKDRNGVPETTRLVYDNSDFLYIQVPTPSGDPATALASYPGYAPVSGQYDEWFSGLRIVTTPSYSGNVMYTSTYTQGCNGANQCTSGQVYSNWQYIDGQGTVHAVDSSLETADSQLASLGYQTGFQANVGQGGLWMVVSNSNQATVYDVHGNIVYGGPLDTQSTEDTNGNVSSGYKDKLGRSVYLLPSGWTVTNKYIYVWTGTGGADIGTQGSGGYTTGPLKVQVIGSITRPDGRAYTFQYDDAGAPPNSQVGHYGSLTQVTLPTGGNINIQSEWFNTAFGLSVITPYVVKSIQTPDGTWSFDYTSPYVTVTAPYDPQTNASSQTRFTNAGMNYPSFIADTYQGPAAGTPLRETSVQWSNGNLTQSIATSLNGTPVSTVKYNYLDLCTQRIGSKQEYDSGGSLLRETDVNYYTSSSDNTALCWPSGTPTFTDGYLQNGHHIADIPQSATVYGAGGCCSSPIAETIYSYDSTNLTATSGSLGNPVLGLQAGGTELHDDQHFGTSMLTRGNLTQVQQMTTPGTFVNTRTNYYNILGELIQSIDANNNVTNYDYTDSWNESSCLPYATFAYLTTATNAKTQKSQSTYNSCDGSVASEKDPNDIANGRAGTVYTYDGLQRVTNTSYPDTGSTGVDYGGSAVPEVITITVQAAPDPNEVSSKTLDGLGRTSTSVAANGATTQTVYDSLGRVYSVSNPYFTKSDPTYGVTTYTYDGLDRTIQQLDADNSSKKIWSYSGNAVTFTDEAGNQWQRTLDALGRLTQVLEPNGSTQTPSLETDYQYDALNDLVRVDQWGGPSGTSGERVRTFVYDSLSRLTNACNPESITTGTMCSSSGPWSESYGYLSNGFPCSGDPTLPCSRTDARGVTATYTYEALNRLYTTTYSDGVTPMTYHVYDTESISIGQPVQHFTTSNVIGRLSVICVWIPSTCQSMTAFSYDARGRVAATITNTPSNATTGAIYTASAGYDLAGHLTSLTYPDGRAVTQSFNGGLLQQVQFQSWNGTSVNYPYFNYAQYWPDGSLMSSIFGSGAEEDFGFNNRLQPTSYSLKGSQAGFQGQVFMNKQLCYFPQCGSGSTNNGNIYQITDVLDNRATQLFSYDSLNRLKGFVRNFESMLQTYSIDAFGNADTTCCTVQNNLSFNTNNHISNSGYGYDAAGNLTTVPNPAGGSDTYTFDAEDRITKFDNGTALYTYDADGNRVRKDIGTGGNNWTEYLYFGGLPVAELTNDLSWSDYIFANGKRIARSDSFDERIHIEGTSNASGSYAAWYLSFSHYIIQSGDKISWRQFQNSAVGGVGISFTDGTNTNWTAQDTDGQVMNSDNTEGSWHFRTVDLTPFAGKAVENLWITADAGTPVGSWSSYFADISIYSTDGEVTPIYYRQTGTSLSYFGGGSESNTQAFVERGNTPGDAESPWNTTTFYSADQIGSTRTLSAGGGWLVSMDTYYPFGQEAFGVPADDNHYKFSGKERDSESGNDYFGARYYSSAMGRFMSPDWGAHEDPVPYAKLDDPQSLNLYSYVLNNPLRTNDPDGHASCRDSFTSFMQCAGNLFGYGHAVTNADLNGALASDAQNALKTMAAAGLQIGGVPAAQALQGKSNKDIVDALAGAQSAQSSGTMGSIALNFDTSQLQHEFPHAGDFGIKGNWNKQAGQDFQQALEDIVKNPSTKEYTITFRGEAGYKAYLDPQSGKAVIFKPNGDFHAAWSLSADQVRAVVVNGKL